MDGPARRRGRRRALRSLAGVVLCTTGLPSCAAPAPSAPPLPLAKIDAVMRLELVPEEPGPARVVWARLLLEPTDEHPLTVAPVGGPDGSPAVLEFRVRWHDFRGDGPTSTGHGGQVTVDWRGTEIAEPGRPAVIAARIDLGELQGALARRVDVEGRLIGIELRRDDARSGGMVMDLPKAHVDTLAPRPEGSLESNLPNGSPEGIFLLAAASPPEDKDATLDRLIDALPASAGRAREAILSALLYLTGEMHGRDAQLWRTWWNRQRSHS